MNTYGPRFSGGYQFPRTHSARVVRGKPIQHITLGNGAEVSIVPLHGARQRMFDVTAYFQEEPGRWIRTSYIAHDELEAKAEFHRLLRRLSP